MRAASQAASAAGEQPAAVGQAAADSCEPPAALSLRQTIDWAAARIGDVSDTPRLDAELLLAHALGTSRDRLLVEAMSGQRPGEAAGLEDHGRHAMAGLLRRRLLEREPVAYIVGERHFRRLTVRCDRRALVPRPESELLVEVGLELPEGVGVIDVGTGSGAIALALKEERPDLALTGSDVSPRALELARENAALLELGVRWLVADVLAGVPEDFVALLANLPYVAESERASLAPEILDHEPAGALFAGEEGLAAIAALATQLAGREHVRLAALEVGQGQAPAVRNLLAGAGFEQVSSLRDLAGIERVVVAERGGGMRRRG